MIFSRHKKLFILGVLLALTVAIPLTIYLVQQQQDNRSKAQASTTLSFSPSSTSGSPIQKNVNETLSLAVSIDPGTNLVSLVSLEIQYDPTLFEVSGTNGFTPNASIFPEVLEGPVYSPGKIQVSLSVGADPTKAIQTVANIGTVTFNTLNGSNSPAQITFGPATNVLSIANSDQANENVVSATNPAFVMINGATISPTIGITITPTITPTPQTSPTLTPTTGASPSPSPTIEVFPESAQIQYNILLHGIGNSGDNSNPTNFLTSNQTPLTQQRTIQVELFDFYEKVKIYQDNSTINYNASTGNYIGRSNLIPSNLSFSWYYIKVKVNGHLKRDYPTAIYLNPGSLNILNALHLIAGDTDSNNSLNILDHGTLLDCGYGDLDPLPMTDPNSTFNTTVCQAHTGAADADLNDDGVISRNDYNLFIREFGVQDGD